MKRAGLHVGLTGGAGSGKTVAMEIWRELGVPVLCADEIARAATSPSGPLLEAVRKAFPQFFDDRNTLNRRLLRSHILADSEAKQKLEEIIHPHVRKEISAWLKLRDEPYCVVVVPLLVETNMRAMFDTVITMACSRETQINRLMARDACSRQDAEQLLENQTNAEKRIKSADEVILNDGDLEELRKRIMELHAQLMSPAD